MVAELLVYLMKPMVRASMSRAFVSQDPERAMSPASARAVCREAWARHRRAAASLPSEPTIGGRLNVRLASVTLEYVRTLEAHGYEREVAVRLVASAAWRLYRMWGSIPRAWDRLLRRPAETRMSRMVRAFLRFPFSEPAYRWDVRERDGTVHLDIRRCPVAEFFVAEGAGDICARTWCRLDYPLAEYWGGRYERDGTLAEGDAVCRMRWITDGQDRSPESC